MALPTARIAGDAAPVAVAHPNIALIKYWGKRPGPHNLPAVGSLSVTLDTLATETMVQLDPELEADVVTLDGAPASEPQQLRVQAFMQRVRALRPGDAAPFARIDSRNNFPTGAGLASSASGFAALALAATRAYGVTLSLTALSALARAGSGSAARSIFGGFVAMARGEREDGEDAVATPLMAPSAWPLRVVVAITDAGPKAVGSTAGMAHTRATSPYWRGWVAGQEADLAEARQAVLKGDFWALADVAEHSCMKMHALALSARPSLLYWRPATLQAMEAVGQLQQDRVPVFRTMDAGPQLKAICLPEAVDQVTAALRAVPGVTQVVVAQLGAGARIVTKPS